MLHLLANEVMLKARDIVGENILDNPEMVNHRPCTVHPIAPLFLLSFTVNNSNC
jgi:hypothetical protein